MTTADRKRRPGRAEISVARFVCVWVAIVSLTLGCSSPGKVQQRLAARMRLGDFPGAILLVEEEKSGVFDGKNELLYYLEHGMLLHVDERYVESNTAFEMAKRIGEDLYTQSLSNSGLSLLSNDYALDYAGEDFERTLIHLFSALNYQQLGDRESALVEVRQVGDYLRKLEVDNSNSRVHKDDAFAHYLSAMFYEANGELDSAFVDYKKAIAAYAAYGLDYAVVEPESLLPNTVGVATRLGDWALSDLEDLGRAAEPRILPEGSGEIVVLHYNGLVPIKDQIKITFPFSQAWLLVAAFEASASGAEQAEIGRATAVASQIAGVDVISVAFPSFVERPYSIVEMVPRVDRALEVTQPELVEDIGAIAEQDLADRIARIRTKAIARAAIKYALQKAIETAVRQSQTEYSALVGAIVQLGGNIVRFATEQADKRGWSTLPDTIWMVSIVVPEGAHDVAIDFLDAQRSVVEARTILGIEVAAGGRRFVIVRTVQ
jgi:hypothetical protein